MFLEGAATFGGMWQHVLKSDHIFNGRHAATTK